MQYFSGGNLETGKIQLIDAKLDVTYSFMQQKSFESVIGYFYGKELQFSRDWDLMKLLNVTATLGIPNLFKKITGDLKVNFDEYGFFLAMQIG